jgi:hypothetical protein
MSNEIDKLKKAFDAGWDGALRWHRSEYPNTMGNKIYVEELEKFLCTLDSNEEA